MNTTIIGGGNLGMSIAHGMVDGEILSVSDLFITKKSPYRETKTVNEKFNISTDNIHAVQQSEWIILAVLPQQLDEVLDGIQSVLNEGKHKIISVVTGAEIKDIRNKIEKDIPIIRAMPNIAAANGHSMTCIAASTDNEEILKKSKAIFDTIGKTLFIPEEQMTGATALCACGIAFFLRMIRAISQAGIEIGFHADESLALAVQTAKGATLLLEQEHAHPEDLIDKVTSPKGCTIAGLNEMEHQGFSSALIKGVKTSFEKAAKLYD